MLSPLHDIDLYSYMCSQAYFADGGTPPEGWVKIAVSPNNNSGYFGVAFQNITDKSKVVIASRGTEITSMDDLLAGERLYFNSEISSQFFDAKAFVDSVANSLKIDAGSIYQTGHSLGGTLAQMLGLTFSSSVTIFNAPGIGQILTELASINKVADGYKRDFKEQIIGYYMTGDVFHKLGEAIGSVIALPNPNALCNPVDSSSFSLQEAVCAFDNHAIEFIHSTSEEFLQSEREHMLEQRVKRIVEKSKKGHTAK